MKRVVVVTGSANGIGLGIANTFLKNNYITVFSDINESALNSVVSEGKKIGECIGIKCDVTREEDIKNMVLELKNKYGRIDILVNNAGLQHVDFIEDFPVEKFEFMLKVELTGPFILMKHIIPLMKAQKWGRIINISSINGLIGFAGKSAYNSAKHGLIGLTKVAALEGATLGITANAICPGYVDTALVRGQMEDLARTRGVEIEKILDEVLYPLIPQKSLVSIDDIANLALFLSSDKAKSITGQSYVIDGGYTAQ